jgi:hypothetical protein
MNLRTEVCPTCQEPWAVERRTSRRFLLEVKDDTVEHELVCGAGHTFTLAAWEQGLPVVAVPELVRTGRLVLRPTNQTCRGKGCGKPIQPGQAWLDRPDGPLHIGCVAA